jgi:hypothetical protein
LRRTAGHGGRKSKQFTERPFEWSSSVHSRMVPGVVPGRKGHRAEGDGWRADHRAGALPVLSMTATGTAVAERHQLWLQGVTVKQKAPDGIVAGVGLRLRRMTQGFGCAARQVGKSPRKSNVPSFVRRVNDSGARQLAPADPLALLAIAEQLDANDPALGIALCFQGVAAS